MCLVVSRLVSQIMLLGCARPDATPYTVYPDVMVFPRPMDRARGHYSLAADGPPDRGGARAHRRAVQAGPRRGWPRSTGSPNGGSLAKARSV